MIQLPSTPKIQTVIDEIDADYNKVSVIPEFALFYKIQIYSFYKSFQRWTTELDIMQARLTKKYGMDAEPSLGNAIAVIDTYRQIFAKARKLVRVCMETLQEPGKSCDGIIKQINQEQIEFKKEMEYLEKSIKLWGDFEEDIDPKDYTNLDK